MGKGQKKKKSLLAVGHQGSQGKGKVIRTYKGLKEHNEEEKERIRKKSKGNSGRKKGDTGPGKYPEGQKKKKKSN